MPIFLLFSYKFDSFCGFHACLNQPRRRLFSSSPANGYRITGIMFQDITTLLLEPKAFKDTVDLFVEQYTGRGISVVAGKSPELPHLQWLRDVKSSSPLCSPFVSLARWSLFVSFPPINACCPSMSWEMSVVGPSSFRLFLYWRIKVDCQAEARLPCHHFHYRMLLNPFWTLESLFGSGRGAWFDCLAPCYRGPAVRAAGTLCLAHGFGSPNLF